MTVSTGTIKEALTGLQGIFVSDLDLSRGMKVKHLRGGKITRQDTTGEGVGVEVHGFGHDELGNIVAICKDGQIRQFIK